MFKAPGVKDRQFAVLGLGRTGLATCHALKRGGADVLSWDEAELSQETARKQNIELVDITRERVWEENKISRLIVSPGIPHLYPEPHHIIRMAMKRGIPVDNDIGLFFHFHEHFKQSKPEDEVPKIVALTGTNGKSTTAALINHVLQSHGYKSAVAGNIGIAVLGLENLEELTHIILEISSYQSEAASRLDPDVAIFLNLDEDHLDRHQGKGGYFAAKRRLFDGANLELAVIGVDEPEGEYLGNNIVSRGQGARLATITNDKSKKIPHYGMVASGKTLTEFSEGKVINTHSMGNNPGLLGNHNLQNAAAAYFACCHLNVPGDTIIDYFNGFNGLPHRSQVVAKKNGVVYINDSKATNVKSTSRALESHHRIHWIAGGLAKNGGIKTLGKSLNNVKHAYFFGHSAKSFALELGQVPHSVFPNLPDAIRAASTNARTGDTVLLAPAAASFDQYRDFEERGFHFIREVNKIT
ncbi:MAG: UDP-N-acetylmuramoyl-L-alanine--D-glutamate ligase [Rhodobacteraceae bacterium]|nr:UDP-N-acetylmuramoyl-L-alanine--D-glutamate ligase [Paracoccaceae bacterium]MCY4250352.1 UDP-N-acetylmuramoyl-L-alanine--D-glutamate ligase [Paracoccaceae bacterium]